MLVLSRKEGESLVIGDNITLVISKVVGNRVTIGIEAPRDVKVMRSELTIDLAPNSNAESGAIAGSPASKKATNRKPRVAAISMKDFTSSVRTLQRNVG